jgi:hypothetical protein
MAYLVTTAPNVANVEPRRSARGRGDSADASHRSCRRKLPFLLPSDPPFTISCLPNMQSNVRLRLRISFAITGRTIQDQVDFTGFPPGLTGAS